ncbi:MAG: HEPN domain-containing protein [Promethearchaeota archaeon]
MGKNFLAHQSAEKLLKSIFAFEGKRIPKIHYIDELGKRLYLKKETLDDVIDLTIDYTFSRYPDVTKKIPYEIYDESTAKLKVDFSS